MQEVYSINQYYPLVDSLNPGALYPPIGQFLSYFGYRLILKFVLHCSYILDLLGENNDYTYRD